MSGFAFHWEPDLLSWQLQNAIVFVVIGTITLENQKILDNSRRLLH